MVQAYFKVVQTTRAGQSRYRIGYRIVIRDDIDYADGRAIPMWALGFMY